MIIFAKESINHRCCDYKYSKCAIISDGLHLSGQNGLNAALHLHILIIDGAYAKPAAAGAQPRLHALSGPSDEDVGMVVEKIARRAVKLLRRKGYLDSEAEFVMRPDVDDMFQDNAAIAAALGASVQSKIAFGPRAGEYVRKIGKGFGVEGARRHW